MGIEKLATWAVGLALLASSTGQLPKIIHAVRIAQLELLRDSQASKWPKLPLLKVQK